MKKPLEKQLEFKFMKEEHHHKKMAELKETAFWVSLYLTIPAVTLLALDKIVNPILKTGFEYLVGLSQNYQGF